MVIAEVIEGLLQGLNVSSERTNVVRRSQIHEGLCWVYFRNWY